MTGRKRTRSVLGSGRLSQTGPVNQEQLLAALSGAGEAAGLCRRALLTGAELEVFPGVVPTAELRTIYRRRAEHLRRTGIAAIDADEAADRLDRTTHVDLVIGKVDGGPGDHFFQLFFDPAIEHLVACLTVPAESRGRGTP
jgi:hypothetical protein